MPTMDIITHLDVMSLADAARSMAGRFSCTPGERELSAQRWIDTFPGTTGTTKVIVEVLGNQVQEILATEVDLPYGWSIEAMARRLAERENRWFGRPPAEVRSVVWTPSTL